MRPTVAFSTGLRLRGICTDAMSQGFPSLFLWRAKSEVSPYFRSKYAVRSLEGSFFSVAVLIERGNWRCEQDVRALDAFELKRESAGILYVQQRAWARAII